MRDQFPAISAETLVVLVAKCVLFSFCWYKAQLVPRPEQFVKEICLPGIHFTFSLRSKLPMNLHLANMVSFALLP